MESFFMKKRGFSLSFKVCLIALLISLSSCFTGYSYVDGRISSPTRVKLLEDTVQSYANSLRWGYYEEIRQFQRTKSNNLVDFSMESIVDHRVVSYENLSKLLSQDGITARVVSKIEYYEIDSGVLATKFYDQNWWYDGVRDRWFLGSSVPTLKIPDK